MSHSFQSIKYKSWTVVFFLLPVFYRSNTPISSLCSARERTVGRSVPYSWADSYPTCTFSNKSSFSSVNICPSSSSCDLPALTRIFLRKWILSALSLFFFVLKHVFFFFFLPTRVGEDVLKLPVGSEAALARRASELNNEVSLDFQSLTSLKSELWKKKKGLCFPSGACRCFFCESAYLPGSPLNYSTLSFTGLTWLKKLCGDINGVQQWTFSLWAITPKTPPPQPHCTIGSYFPGQRRSICPELLRKENGLSFPFSHCKVCTSAE